MKTLLILLCCLPWMVSAQKEIYIPLEWQQPNGLEYSFDRSAASANFIVFWGPLAGDDPTQAPANIAFDPNAIVNTAEDLYRYFIDTIQFVNDDAGLISQYKIILVMLHTWPGLEGWAFGGNYDGIVGAMWMHPHAALSGPTLAHEFAHTLQNYTWMMNPGHGFIDSSYVGFFWETHAEFMALQRYPSVAREFDMARWLNTCHFHWSSTRHHYQAFIFLQFLKEIDGITMINRLWSESIIGEHPLETYKRLKGIDQEQLNDLFAEYAMRNVTWDYDIGDDLRERISTLDFKFVSHPTFIPEKVEHEDTWYKIQEHLAPQDYGYNIIRLYPTQSPDCDDRVVHLKVAGHANWPQAGAGWRFGLVAVKNGHEARYSQVYHEGDEMVFPMQPDETGLYLVVTGAPSTHHNYAWEIGYPKTYRYPYDFRIENAVPEGFQAGFRDPPEGVLGAPHSNGGGFVASTASVDPTAYVGPEAQVLDYAEVRDFARVEGKAMIRDNAFIGGNATIHGHAIIGENAHVYDHALVTDQAHVFAECQIYDNAIVVGNSLLFFTSVYDEAVSSENTFCWGASIHGDVVLGGDAEFFIECDNGTYYQFQGAYGRECDGLDDHPANTDVNPNFGNLNSWDVALVHTIHCNAVYEEIFEHICEGDTFDFNGTLISEPGTYTDTLSSFLGIDSIVTVHLVFDFPLIGNLTGTLCPGDTSWIFGYPFLPGIAYDTLLDFGHCGIHLIGMLETFTVDTTLLVLGHLLEIQQPSFFAEWYDCETGLPIPGAVGKTFTPEKSGYYKARLITTDSCDIFTECAFVIGTGTGIPGQDFQFTIYPNPVKDLLSIEPTGNSNTGNTIEILNPLGQRMYYLPAQDSPGNQTIDISHLVPGMYLIRIIDSGNFSHQKLVFKTN